MIQTNELRIGNLLQDKVTKTLLEVIELNKSDIVTYVIDRSMFPLNEGWGLEPIELTEEWLLKLGFEKSNDLDAYCHVVVNDNWAKLYYNPKYKICELSISGYGVDIKIKSVHKLQNLYFFLTGQELTLKD